MSTPVLSDVTVLDVSTLLAGGLASMLLGDFGARVIKVEHPRGDPLRRLGPRAGADSVWWKLLARNKQSVTLDLEHAEARALLRRLVLTADVLVENFRPGTLERWQLGPDELRRENPRLVVARISGFGRAGAYSARPGFGSLAEALSGFASLNRDQNGRPRLAPFPLADGTTGMAAALAIAFALIERNRSGQGQVVDLSLVEPLLGLLGPSLLCSQLPSESGESDGESSPNSAPRGVFETLDGKWVAVSASAEAVARRVMQLVGHPEVCVEPWFEHGGERARRARQLNGYVGDWIARHDLESTLAAFERANAAVAPVRELSEVLHDAQLEAIEAFVRVEDGELGAMQVQNVMFRLLGNPGKVKWMGRPLGWDNAEIYRGQLGLTEVQLQDLAARGVM